MQIAEESAVSPVASIESNLGESVDAVFEFSLAEVAASEATATRDVVDMLFDVDQLDDLLGELLS
jgi:hypothetical protein